MMLSLSRSFSSLPFSLYLSPPLSLSHNPKSKHLPSRPPKHTNKPIRPTNHKTMAGITLLHNIKRVGLNLLRARNDATHNFQTKTRLIRCADHIGGGNPAPGRVGSCVVVEDSFCGGRGDG